MELIVYWSCEC